MITTSHPGEWDALMPATRGVSHRSTTSSRHPGRAIEGSVSYALARIGRCESCGFMRRLSTHPHAPHWTLRGGRHVQVDCAGNEVSP